MNHKAKSWIVVAALCAATFDSAAATFNIGPTEFRSSSFWQNVQTTLASEPVDVVLASGNYYINTRVLLNGIGHSTNGLVIRAATQYGPVIREDPDNTAWDNTLVELFECRNVTIRGWRFTGSQLLGRALRISDCQNIWIENCKFDELTGTYYAALAVNGDLCDTVVVRGCTFLRVGRDSHCHMIYTANSVKRLMAINTTFEDCSGDFVRYRNLSDFGVVWGCTFKSTGTYLNANPPMVSVPLFNNVDPGDEYFGTNFIVGRNTFSWGTSGDQSKRFAFQFHHSGYNPPGLRHLLTQADATVLSSGTVAERRALLLNNMRIDIKEVFYFGNTSTNVLYNVIYDSNQAYGATSDFEGYRSIGSLINGTSVAATEAAATTFYESVKFAIPAASVTASAQDGTNGPANTVDNNYSTRWSANGDGQWIRYNLGSIKTVSRLRIAWHNGDERVQTFDIQTSNNGTSWTTVASGIKSSGTTERLETFDFPDRAAQYVRVVGHGNTVNTWNSILETEVWGTMPTKISVPSSYVVASADDGAGNVASRTVDGNMTTRWSADGDGQWIRYDLRSTRAVSNVKIAWHNGDARVASFDVQVSLDGSSWTTVFSGQSSGTTTAFETYDFGDAYGRYVRIVGHGNSVNTWNSILETEIWGL